MINFSNPLKENIGITTEQCMDWCKNELTKYDLLNIEGFWLIMISASLTACYYIIISKPEWQNKVFGKYPVLQDNLPFAILMFQVAFLVWMFLKFKGVL